MFNLNYFSLHACVIGCDLLLGGIEREEDDDPDLIAQGLCSNVRS